MDSLTHEPVVGVERFRGQPLAIVGAGPSYDAALVAECLSPHVNVFALNHTITELFWHPLAWWVSNDMDRTFGNVNIARGIAPKIKDYAPWRTVTQRLFIPGTFGSHAWYDKRGELKGPIDFRLPCPAGSHVAWYLGGEGRNAEFDGYVRNGHSVLELALEVATLWGFGPIVLFGCDLHMPTEETYYAEPLRWKDTPAKIVRGKLKKSRSSIVQNRNRWPRNISSVNTAWTDGPFEVTDYHGARSLLGVGSGSHV